MKTVFVTSGFPNTMPPLPRDKWVALSEDGTLVAVGDSVRDVLEKAKLRGENTPIITGDVSLPSA